MARTKRVGYAVVGLGSISKVAVLPAFPRSKKARLVAVVSADKEKARKFAREFKAGHAYTYDGFHDCLKNPEIEAVYIATPPGEHEKYMLLSAQAGKHVLCEKPLAATVKQAQNMVEASERHKVKFMTAYRKYFEPSTVTFKKMISNGELGRIDVIHTLFAELHRFGDNSPAWLFSRELSGGGPLTDLGSTALTHADGLSEKIHPQPAPSPGCAIPGVIKRLRKVSRSAWIFRAGSSCKAPRPTAPPSLHLCMCTEKKDGLPWLQHLPSKKSDG